MSTISERLDSSLLFIRAHFSYVRHPSTIVLFGACGYGYGVYMNANPVVTALAFIAGEYFRSYAYKFVRKFCPPIELDKSHKDYKEFRKWDVTPNGRMCYRLKNIARLVVNLASVILTAYILKKNNDIPSIISTSAALLASSSFTETIIYTELLISSGGDIRFFYS